MNPALDRKRIAVFLAFAFGISWATGGYIALNGGLLDSPEVIPNSGITQAYLLIALVYMTAPAVANILTRVVTREGRKDLYLHHQLGRGWRYWLLAWLGTPVLILLGGAVYFLLFPGHFDSGLTQVAGMMADFEELTGEAAPVSPGVFVVFQMVQALMVAPLINSIFTLGEEFGWRAYLQQKLMPLGVRKAMAWMGVIWGVWHWPVILMGHNYGLDYPGAPWAGCLVFTWFTFVVGVYFGWMVERAGSVWPAVIGHAVLNGFAGAVILLTIGEPNPLLGPSVAGLVGMLPFTVVGLWLIFKGDWSGKQIADVSNGEK